MPHVFQTGLAKVTIELPSGELITASGYLNELSLERPMQDITKLGSAWVSMRPGEGGNLIMDLSLTEGNTVISVDAVDAKDYVEEMKTAEEWQCPYCSGANPRAHTKCGNCGAVRSVLYG